MRQVIIVASIIVVILCVTLLMLQKKSKMMSIIPQVKHNSQSAIYVCSNYLSESCPLAINVAELFFPNTYISEYLGQDTYKDDILIVVCGCGHAYLFNGIILYIDNGQGKLHLPGVTQKQVVYAGVPFPSRSELILRQINLYFVTVVATLLSVVYKDGIKRSKHQTRRSFLMYHSTFCLGDADRVFDILINIAEKEGFDTPVASGNCLWNHPKWRNGTITCLFNTKCDIQNLIGYKFALVVDTNINGYVSQKIFDAFLAGCIPIYYGTKDVFKLFNRNSFIYFDLQNPQKAINNIIQLQKNKDAYLKMINLPILANGYNTVQKYFSLRSDIGAGELRKAVLDAVNLGKSEYIFQKHVYSSFLNNLNKSKTNNIFTPFYVYNESECAVQNWSSCLKDDVDTELISMFKNHPWRTREASKAKVFIIPTPIYASYHCDRKNHNDRLDKTMEMIVSNSYFKRYNGRDHLFMAHAWEFSMWATDSKLMMGVWWEKLSEVTAIRYEYYGMSKWENLMLYDSKIQLPKALYNVTWEPTKRSIVCPDITSYYLNICTQTYSEWIKRSNLIWSHVRSTKYAHGATKLRHMPVNNKNMFPGDIGFEIPRDKWISGWSKSKFCLVMRGDTPTSHSFYNAIVSSCIPVIISDSFELVGMPFKDLIPFRSIVVQFSEKQFLTAPETIVPLLRNISENEIKTKLYNIKLVQPMLIIRHRKSMVVELILRQFVNIIDNIFSMHEIMPSNTTT